MRASLFAKRNLQTCRIMISLVRAGRLELPRPLGQQILSLPRLPFRHARRAARIYYKARHPVNAPLLAQEFRPSARLGGS